MVTTGCDALEYATARTLDMAQVPAYGIGLFQRLDHLFDALDAELKAAQDGLAREETNLATYTDQLARRRGTAQRDLRVSTASSSHHVGSSGPPVPPPVSAGLADEAASFRREARSPG